MFTAKAYIYIPLFIMKTDMPLLTEKTDIDNYVYNEDWHTYVYSKGEHEDQSVHLDTPIHP